MKNLPTLTGDERGKSKDLPENGLKANQERNEMSRWKTSQLKWKTEEENRLIWRKGSAVKNHCKKPEAQVFLAFLLASALARQPRFCLVAPMSVMVGLALGGAILTRGENNNSIIEQINWWNTSQL